MKTLVGGMLAGVLCSAALGSELAPAGSAGTPARRVVVSLDGTWQIAEGKMDEVPTGFDRSVPVPGLASLAKPVFAHPPGPRVADERDETAQSDPHREAFWYRRTFRLDDALPTIARLTIHKAMFGTRVILNGRVLGDHLPCFTPGTFDARPALKRGENEIVIRVGAARSAVGAAIPSGFDFEKTRYIPGIFDSVELILSGTPHFVSVQTVPEIETKTVRVHAMLRNDGEPSGAPITFVVREAKSGREAGRITTAPAKLGRGEETTVEARIVLADCRLWSPEDPFLYFLEADSGADQFTTRFGMREFKFDPVTKKALLNGRPYPMRGSNITLYRFFEDPECGDLPWRDEWVRRLHRQVKGMHWNCLRYCIGFPPELWYRIADEEGVLLQDEFPIWYGGTGWSKWNEALKSSELAREFSDWMRERWNHPSVVIWDASNETTATETGVAVQQVRGLDLSHRPWDNSYGLPRTPGDVFESHPYHFQQSTFELADLAHATPVPHGSDFPNPGDSPVIINEYGWLWLNRDGSPTTLTKDLYRNLLGPESTVAERRHLYARYLAAETEFWRSYRQAAAVMHFTALGYSRADGQTSDHWTDVKKLEWEPEFRRYVRDAFAPVGLMIHAWDSAVIGGSATRVTVRTINDLARPWSGPVTLRLGRADGGPAIFTQRQTCRIEPYGEAELTFDVTWPKETGTCILEAELSGDDGAAVRSVREFSVTDVRSFGIAYQSKASASSTRSPTDGPANAVDGDRATLWVSAPSENAWLTVDLGTKRPVSRVRIIWGADRSDQFAVQVSDDGANWTDVRTAENDKAVVTEFSFAPVAARHIRIHGTHRANANAAAGSPAPAARPHSIRELQVFE